jgi:hypothetical protein
VRADALHLLDVVGVRGGRRVRNTPPRKHDKVFFGAVALRSFSTRLKGGVGIENGKDMPTISFTARVLLPDSEAEVKEEYMASGSCTRSTFRNL